MGHYTPITASNIATGQPNIFKIQIFTQKHVKSHVPIPAAAPIMKEKSPKTAVAARTTTGRTGQHSPLIKEVPDDSSIKASTPISGKQSAPSGERAIVPRLKIPQPQNHSTIPWPTASLHTINLPKDVILNTHDSTRSSPWILGNMILYPAKSLGSGAYARVISGFEVSRSTGKAREVAIKVLSTFYKQEFSRECNAMALLKDTQTLPELFAAGQGNDYFYIVMEKFRTTFDTQLCIYRRMGYAGIPCTILPRVVKEILLLISEMHDRHMVHFDIKPCNILVAEDGRLVLSDAAFCHRFPVHKDCGQMPFRGTEGFMAPEVLFGYEVDDARPADMFSLGMTIAVARGVKIPGAGASLDELEEMVDAAFPPESQWLANDFLTRLVEMPHERRMTAGEALAHRWLEDWSVEPREVGWMHHLPSSKRKPVKLPHPGNIEEIVLTDEGHVRSISSIMRGLGEPPLN